MDKVLTRDELLQFLKRTCLDMETKQEELRQLDAVAGDGDLGVTVKLGFKTVRESLHLLSDKDIGAILVQSGIVFNKAAASTYGTLMATIFMRAGRQVTGKETLCLEDIAAMVNSAVDGVIERGGASLGDCTLLDSLIPVQQTIKQCTSENLKPHEILVRAVESATKGAESTIEMEAKHGRASWSKGKSKGTPDAGAIAITHILESILQSYETAGQFDHEHDSSLQ